MNLKALKDKKKNIKKEIQEKETGSYSKGFQAGIEKSFQIFEFYIKQYKRYKNNVKLLMKEEKKLWKKWVNYYEKHSNIKTEEYENRYNEWLFENLFSDINLTEEGNILTI
ncbi:MAG: hypothetical protein V5A68_07595 [Candidatus Thermoplasmatota archaeon]